MNGIVMCDLISDDGSVERGIEMFEDKNFGSDYFCFIMFLLLYEDCY